MSDELLKNEGEGEDNETEAHQLKSAVRNKDAEGAEGAEDVEGHLYVRQANDDDDSDDVEAHRFRA
jgi:hypothetical protein